MVLGSSRALKTSKWYSNELLRYEDLNYLSQATYQNLTDLLALLASQVDEDGTGADRVVSGLEVEWDNLLTLYLHAGAAISFSGRYFTSSAWGFVSALGESFSVYVDHDLPVSVDPGGAQDRIDIVEVRPVQADYDPSSREFKDPVTGVVTTVVTDIKREYGVEMQVRKGMESVTPSAPSTTSGWIKVAEIYVAAGASALTQSDIKDVRNSDSWTTESGSTKYAYGTGSDFRLTGTLSVDTISEYTPGSGVTVEGVLFDSGSLTASGLVSTATLDVTSSGRVDTVTEYTADAGVTVEGVLLKDSNIICSGRVYVGNVDSSGATIYLNHDGTNPVNYNATLYVATSHYMKWINSTAKFYFTGGLEQYDTTFRLGYDSTAFRDVDTAVWFASTAYLSWDQSTSRFVFGQQLSINDSSLLLNHNGASFGSSADTVVYFASSRCLYFTAASDMFTLNTRTNISGALYVNFNFNGTWNGGDTYVYMSTGEYLRWHATLGMFQFSAPLYVTSYIYDTRTVHFQVFTASTGLPHIAVGTIAWADEGGLSGPRYYNGVWGRVNAFTDAW